MIYGYCRISTSKQSIDRQIRNIKEAYPDIMDTCIFKEAYTGTKLNRPQFDKLLNIVKAGDTIIFDSVSRMSRNAEEGTDLYFELYNKGINLVFLKEHYIDTDIYKSTINGKIELTGSEVDCILEGINKYFKILAEKQIRIAFEQAQKEVDDLHKRTSEGLETAKLNGKQVGNVKGTKLTTKKSITAKEQIKKYSKRFNGSLNDQDTMKIVGIARNTYYKYLNEMAEENA